MSVIGNIGNAISQTFNKALSLVGLGSFAGHSVKVEPSQKEQLEKMLMTAIQKQKDVYTSLASQMGGDRAHAEKVLQYKTTPREIKDMTEGDLKIAIAKVYTDIDKVSGIDSAFGEIGRAKEQLKEARGKGVLPPSDVKSQYKEQAIKPRPASDYESSIESVGPSSRPGDVLEQAERNLRDTRDSLVGSLEQKLEEYEKELPNYVAAMKADQKLDEAATKAVEDVARKSLDENRQTLKRSASEMSIDELEKEVSKIDVELKHMSGIQQKVKERLSGEQKPAIPLKTNGDIQDAKAVAEDEGMPPPQQPSTAANIPVPPPAPPPQPSATAPTVSEEAPKVDDKPKEEPKKVPYDRNALLEQIQSRKALKKTDKEKPEEKPEQLPGQFSGEKAKSMFDTAQQRASDIESEGSDSDDEVTSDEEWNP
tara:strand:- start:25590 stop:26861 length:1272 start_codon:yes stop_codon:yes gene_type:complete